MKHLIDLALILFALAGAVSFVIAYPALTDPARWTREGRHLWFFTLAVTSLGGLSVARRLLDVEHHAWYVVAVWVTYLSLGVLLWQRVALLVSARREARDHVRQRLTTR